mgnify:CR=1 FL=1
MKQKITKIKESITEVEYKRLMNSLRGNDSIRENSKQNLLRTFCILFHTGLRVNELQQLRLHHIKELIDNGSTKIILPKTSSERKLYAGANFVKQLSKLFSLNGEDLTKRVIIKGSVKSGKSGINNDVFIKQVNSTMHEILGSGYTSHSFRQGLITEMGANHINLKIISRFIGHSDVKTTMRYIQPTDQDIKGALIR